LCLSPLHHCKKYNNQPICGFMCFFNVVNLLSLNN
jgi:hypothetical protein